jgi:hypothetical protein
MQPENSTSAPARAGAVGVIWVSKLAENLLDFKKYSQV